MPIARFQRVEVSGKHRIVLGHHFVVHASALVSQKQTIDAAIGSALEQASGFHFVQQLADVAFRDQQRVGQLLLTDSL